MHVAFEMKIFKGITLNQTSTYTLFLNFHCSFLADNSSSTTLMTLAKF